MKKFRFLLMVAVATLVGFASCGKDDENPGAATINAVSTYQVPSDLGDFNITGSVVAPADGKLSSVRIYAISKASNGQEIKKELSIPKISNDQTYAFVIQNTSSVTGIIALNYDTTMTSILIVAQVKDGDESSKTITLKKTDTPATDTPLGAATAFTWKRVGSAAATGVTDYGLTWTSNKAVYAQITKGTATKMVDLGSAKWTSITTKEALKAAIDAGTDMAVYGKVSASADGTYNDVLGVINNGTYYMINVTNGKVTSNTSGTTIEITGNSKN